MTLSVAQISAIRMAAFDVGMAEGNLEDATKKALEVVTEAGGDQEPIKHEYWIGYMASRIAKLNGQKKASAKLLEEAAAMREGNAPDAKTVKVGKPTRTPEWQAAYAAARKAWERLLKKEDVKTTEARGGARERTNDGAGTAAKTEVKATEPKAPTVPKCVDRKAANAWFARETAILNTFCLYNKDHVDEAIAVKVDTFRRELLAMLKD